jgi:hypothetical protein
VDKDEIYATLNQAYFADNCHERELLDNLSRFIADASFFVDIGASLGQYTRAASRAMHSGRVLAIEADPVRHEELARNAVRWAAETGCRIDTTRILGEARVFREHFAVPTEGNHKA